MSISNLDALNHGVPFDPPSMIVIAYSISCELRSLSWPMWNPWEKLLPLYRTSEIETHDTMFVPLQLCMLGFYTT